MRGPKVIDLRTEAFVRALGQRLRDERLAHRYALKDVVRLGGDLSHTSQLEKGLLSNVTINTAIRHLAVYGLTLTIAPTMASEESHQ